LILHKGGHPLSSSPSSIRSTKLNPHLDRQHPAAYQYFPPRHPLLSFCPRCPAFSLTESFTSQSRTTGPQHTARAPRHRALAPPAEWQRQPQRAVRKVRHEGGNPGQPLHHRISATLACRTLKSPLTKPSRSLPGREGVPPPHRPPLPPAQLRRRWSSGRKIFALELS